MQLHGSLLRAIGQISDLKRLSSPVTGALVRFNSRKINHLDRHSSVAPVMEWCGFRGKIRLEGTVKRITTPQRHWIFLMRARARRAAVE